MTKFNAITSWKKNHPHGPEFIIYDCEWINSSVLTFKDFTNLTTLGLNSRMPSTMSGRIHIDQVSFLIKIND
jgi:hypothetical protein